MVALTKPLVCVFVVIVAAALDGNGNGRCRMDGKYDFVKQVSLLLSFSPFLFLSLPLSLFLSDGKCDFVKQVSLSLFLSLSLSLSLPDRQAGNQTGRPAACVMAEREGTGKGT